MRVYFSFDTPRAVVGDQRYYVATIDRVPHVGEYVLFDLGDSDGESHKVEVVTHVVHTTPNRANNPDAYVVLRGRP